ncbi:GNAT family N-acetyltransferase [Acidiluteibacter ferrifornacis]|jgi:RimJ/RimL family protein N-acetyltransferase|uniref:GNAT family N-acetyltransferase n=1 Tax=Acidiluteibacter ferrifornacis TaxID=2692424 RepID=A0A6N9NP30_9FLAO|nr:GNAT family N-acetyltransferase [Acidiluteibacter ferrifornacis]NBG67151.1 GNAT family N-acetyltransferase [Acidiluteibacter ferrifornacis]
MQPPPPFEIQLKNGQVVTVRSATPDDAEHLLLTIKNYIPDSEFIPKLSEEISMTTPQCEEWIQSFIQNENSMLLVAEHQQRIIGNIDLTGSRRKLMQHTAVIGMGILSEYRNGGLGTALMDAIIKWARANPILELIWLQVYAQNHVAISLYHKMGFVDHGIIPGFFKHQNQYYDNLTMSMRVKEF